jgi:hypothetical protein
LRRLIPTPTASALSLNGEPVARHAAGVWLDQPQFESISITTMCPTKKTFNIASLDFLRHSLRSFLRFFMSESAVPANRYPLFNPDNAALGIDRIVEGMVSVANYEWYEQCILKEASHMKDPTRFNHEFIRFVIWYLLHSPDRQSPRYHIVTIDIHRSGGVGGGYSNSGAISANSSSASLPSDSGSSNSQPVPACDEIHIHPQNERLINNQYPGAVSHRHLKFKQSEPTSVIQLFALLSTITRGKQNYDFTSTNCYWLSRTLWEAMLKYFPYDKETPCKPDSRGQLGLFTNVTAKDIEKMKQSVKGEVRTLYETRLKEIRDLAIANKEVSALILAVRLQLNIFTGGGC